MSNEELPKVVQETLKRAGRSGSDRLKQANQELATTQLILDEQRTEVEIVIALKTEMCNFMDIHMGRDDGQTWYQFFEGEHQ